MVFSDSKRTTLQLTNASAMVAGTLLLMPTSGLAAPGDQIGSMKQLRLDNPNMSRRELRQEFRIQRGLNLNSNIKPNGLNANGNAAKNIIRAQNREIVRALKLENQMIRFTNQSSQLSDSGHIVRVNHGIDIDLNSTEQNITLGEKLFKNVGTVTIQSGGVQKTFSAGSKVTAAEYVACRQMLLAGKQTVHVDADGRAIGGEVDLSALSSRGDKTKIDDLFIPTNLTAFGDVSKRNTFQVAGDLTNAGSLYVYTSGKNPNKGYLKADNITNEETGLISSVLSDAVANANGGSQANVDLELNANDTFTNHGLVESSGDLTVTANNVLNTSAATGAPEPVLKAAGDVNIMASHVVNNGLIQSNNAGVHFDAPTGSELNVFNHDGVISALNGAIDLRTPVYNEAFNTTLTGGDLLSKTFNVHAGQGTADIKVNELTGQVNETGLASHVEASTAVLNLGNICLTGDPTYKNDSGSIYLSGDITVGEALTIIASKDIVNTQALTITAGIANKGFPITLIAGADITSNGTNTSAVPSGNGGVATTISGKSSATGGNIVLTSLAEAGAVTINSRGTNAKGTSNGGDIMLVAYANDQDKNGVIVLTGSSINSGGRGSGKNGDVTIIAGGRDDSNYNAVQTGTINATGGTGGGGNIDIDLSRPYSTNGDPVSFNADGTLNGTNKILQGTLVQNNASVLVDGNLTANEFINLECGGGNSDYVKLESGIIAKTLAADGYIKVRTVFHSDVAQEAGSLYSTNHLILSTTDGNIGSFDKPVLTDAKQITITGDNTKTYAYVNTTASVVDVDATCLHLNLTATGNIISNPGNSISVAGANLVSLTGNIGLSNNAPLELSAFTVQFQAKGDVFVHNNYNGTTNFDGINKAGGTYSVSTDGAMISDASFSLTAPKVELKTATGFQTGFTPKINALTSITLTSASSIITANLNTSQMTTPLLVLNCDNNIGVSSGNRLILGPNIGGVKVFAKDTYIFSQSTNKKGFNIAGGNTDQFSVRASGGINITGDVTSSIGHDIIITAEKGFINVKPAVKLLSHQNLTLQVIDTSASASKSKITFGKNSDISTLAAVAGLGDIKISIGPQSAAKVGTAPSKGLAYAENGGKVYFGAGGITTKGALNSFYAKGADIIFNNPFKASNISFAGGVKVVADPPVANPDPVWIGGGVDKPALNLVNPTTSSLTSDINASIAPLMNTSIPSATPPDLNQTRSAQLSSITALNLFAAQDAHVVGDTSDESAFEDDSFVTTHNSPTGIVSSTLCAGNDLRDSAPAGEHFAPLQSSLELKSGHSVFVATQDTELTSSFGKVRLKEGSVALVSNLNTGMSVYNLHDNRKNSVTIELSGKEFSLAPGQHLTVASTGSDDFSSVNAIEAIAHRSMKTRTLDAGNAIFTSEFSVPNAIDTVRSLKSITSSSNPQIKKISDKMIKTAAVLMYLGGSQGDFQTYTRPQVTALNPKF